MTTSLSVTLILLLFSICLGSEQVYRQALGSIISDRVLLGCTIATFKTSDFLSCAQKCLAHSQCKSYNYYNTTENNGLCEINSENQGHVEEHFSYQPGSLFGRLMAIKNPRSCLDLLESGFYSSGFYTVWDSRNHPFRVFCDLASENSWAWTLVMSQAYHNKDIKKLTKVPFYVDGSLNPSNPNWSAYRLHLRQMQDLKAVSSHWRITCNFPVKVFDRQDYVKGNFSKFNILSFDGRYACKFMDYINIKGYNCSQCTAAWWQETGSLLHHDLSLGPCSFGKSKPPAISVWNADYFGYYENRDTSFSCSSEHSSTTNHWFGGTIPV